MDPVEPKMVKRRGVEAGSYALMLPGSAMSDQHIRPDSQKESQKRQGKNQAVDSVEHTAMSGDNVATVLYIKVTLDNRFNEITDLGPNGKKPPCYRKHKR